MVEEATSQMSEHPARRRDYVGRHRRPVPPRGVAAFVARMRSRRAVVSVLRMIIGLAPGRLSG